MDYCSPDGISSANARHDRANSNHRFLVSGSEIFAAALSASLAMRKNRMRRSCGVSD
jgi:hypothetical protein